MPSVGTQHGKPQLAHQLAVRQSDNKRLEGWCRWVGKLLNDPKCKKENNDSSPGNGNSPENPGNKPPPPATTTPPAPVQPPTTVDIPRPPTTTSTPAARPPPATSTAPTPHPPASSVPANPAPSPTNTRPDAGNPQTSAQGLPPAASSVSQPGASSGGSEPVALPAITGTETADRPRSLVTGTPTPSTFTSLIQTVSRGTDGVEYTTVIASTGVTTVTPLVPAPTDLGGGSTAPGSPASAGASAKSTNVGAIVGGILGALAFLVMCALAVLLYQRRKRKRTAPSSEFLRRYGNTTLHSANSINNPSPFPSGDNVSQMEQALNYTQGSYTHFLHPNEKRG